MQVWARGFDGENTQQSNTAHQKDKNRIARPPSCCDLSTWCSQPWIITKSQPTSVRALSPKTHRGSNPRRNQTDGIIRSRRDSSPLYIQVWEHKMLLQNSIHDPQKWVQHFEALSIPWTKPPLGAALGSCSSGTRSRPYEDKTGFGHKSFYPVSLQKEPNWVVLAVWENVWHRNWQLLMTSIWPG